MKTMSLKKLRNNLTSSGVIKKLAENLYRLYNDFIKLRGKELMRRLDHVKYNRHRISSASTFYEGGDQPKGRPFGLYMPVDEFDV